LFISLSLVLLAFVLNGCGGSGEIQLPTTELTEEQKKQIREEDAKIADEESQGAKKR
jgi:predicted small lipoprotein YifL